MDLMPGKSRRITRIANERLNKISERVMCRMKCISRYKKIYGVVIDTVPRFITPLPD